MGRSRGSRRWTGWFGALGVVIALACIGLAGSRAKGQERVATIPLDRAALDRIRERGYIDFGRDLPPTEVLLPLARAAATEPIESVAYFAVDLDECEVGTCLSERARSEMADVWPGPVRAAFAKLTQELDADGKPPELGKAWLGMLLDGTPVYVLSAREQWAYFHDYYVTVLDLETGRAPPFVRLDGHWLDCASSEKLGPPRIQQTDLDRDGRPELVLSAFDHNGTVTNTDVLEHYALTSAPELRLVVRLSERQWLSVVSPDERGYAHRRLVRTAAGGLDVRVWYECPFHGTPPTVLGEAHLRREADGGAYVVDSITPRLPAEEYLAP